MFNNFFQKIESRSVLTFCLLLVFHALVAIILFVIANSEYLSHLHNGQGFWNFSRDSTLYHQEAINSSAFLHNSQWLNWFTGYDKHHHVKLIALVYWFAFRLICFAYVAVTRRLRKLAVSIAIFLNIFYANLITE